jgi:hypothetical protein
VDIHLREGVVLLFVYKWDGCILKNLVEEFIFHTYDYELVHFLHQLMLSFFKSLDFIPSWCRLNEVGASHE